MKKGIRCIRPVALIALLTALLVCLAACQESTASKYDRANKLVSEGKYLEAAAVFDEVSSYEDSSKMAMYAKAISAAENGDYETAFSTFRNLGDFKDCPMMIIYYTGRQAEASVYDGAWIYGSKWFDAIKQYESNPLFRDSADRAEACRKAAYDQAVTSGDQGDTRFAVSLLKELGSYSDSPKQKTYYEAKALLANSQYREASEQYAAIPGFRDADALVTSVMDQGYEAAAAKEEAGDLDAAHKVFLNLGDYKDAATRAYKLYYDAAVRMREGKDWDGAREAFAKAGNYSDAGEQIKETTYLEADALEATGDQESAYQLFISLKDYRDSYERANKPFYDLGIQKRDAGDWDGARATFEKAGDYSDAGAQIRETTYQEAAACMAAAEYQKAYTLYRGIKGYKDVDRLIKKDDNLAAAARAPYREVGNTVTFGTYPQTEAGNDQTPIEWIVLDYDETNHKALLLSRYGLDAASYNTKYTEITWEKCTLRTWLNGEFLNKAFSAAEKSAISMTKVDNSKSQGYSEWNTDGGNNTEDRIFLLSYAEANRYLGVTYNDSNNLKSRVAPTAYALAQGAWTSDSNKTEDGAAAGWWWLRSPGYYQDFAADVTSDGHLNFYDVNNDDFVVRPAFWLNLESDIF